MLSFAAGLAGTCPPLQPATQPQQLPGSCTPQARPWACCPSLGTPWPVSAPAPCPSEPHPSSGAAAKSGCSTAEGSGKHQSTPEALPELLKGLVCSAARLAASMQQLVILYCADNQPRPFLWHGLVQPVPACGKSPAVCVLAGLGPPVVAGIWSCVRANHPALCFLSCLAGTRTQQPRIHRGSHTGSRGWHAGAGEPGCRHATDQ